MMEIKSIRDCIVEVESAKDIEQLKEAVLSALKAIDKEIFWLENK